MTVLAARALIVFAACTMAGAGFGFWQGSIGAGVWMFVLMVWLEGLSENLKRC